jgi:hypothetical protein
VNQSQSPFTGRQAHCAYGAPDESPALGPHSSPIAESVSAEVVTVDEPGVQAGKNIRRRAGDLGIDRDHRGTDEPVAHVRRRWRVKPFDRECPPNCGRGDADLDGSVHERPLTDTPKLRQWVLLGRGEIVRPSQHSRNRLSIEEPLIHRRSA